MEAGLPCSKCKHVMNFLTYPDAYALEIIDGQTVLTEFVAMCPNCENCIKLGKETRS